MSVWSFMRRSAAKVVNCLDFSVYLMPFSFPITANRTEDFFFFSVIILEMLKSLSQN